MTQQTWTFSRVMVAFLSELSLKKGQLDVFHDTFKKITKGDV